MTDDASRTAAELSRRSILRRMGVAGLGLSVGAAAVPSVASANVVDKITFCGCSQVVVYGTDLEDGEYMAVLYCGEPGAGHINCAPLTGTTSRVNYEIDDDGCKVIGVVGTTNPEGSEGLREQTFSVCNQYGPHRCAEKALATVAPDDILQCLVDNATSDAEKTIRIASVESGNAEYEFTVSGELLKEGASGYNGLEPDDEIEGNTASGVVGSGADTYRYSGDITSFRFTKETTRVLVEETEDYDGGAFGRQVNLLCERDPDRLGISVRNGQCGPEDPGRGPGHGRGEPSNGQRGKGRK